ncbi:hypothetical protein C7974DRAFT_413420 [Boeremia exigua]|uniref:uncharacterized protein n=1 Tax=Boeremia exigua TaxID=749465 RepID=UPI001E8D87FB|nr:uncharacterized protein C7974DRAFT_413420 [Boeremia exigua]KAH6629641.1 hypothetical protein C7974DRAFT_413420 [Boeremia exigua]
MSLRENEYYIIMIFCGAFGLFAAFTQGYFAWKPAKTRYQQFLEQELLDLSNHVEMLHQRQSDRLTALEAALALACTPAPPPPAMAPTPYILRVECGCACAHSPPPPPPPSPPPPPATSSEMEDVAESAAAAAAEMVALATTTSLEAVPVIHRRRA